MVASQWNIRCDYTINPVKGLCPVDCKDNQGKSYCYARRMYKNPYYKAMYSNQSIRFDWSVANDLPKMKVGSKVFWGSTMELFGDWIEPEWLRLIFEAVKHYSELTHIFLTKQPQNLMKWSPFPENCGVGVSVTANGDMTRALTNLAGIKAGYKFLSIEPLLGMIGMNDHMPLQDAGIGQVIIGQLTPVKKATMPKIEWIQEIVEAGDKAGIPIFLKNNLWKALVPPHGIPPIWARGRNGQDADCLRQEFPQERQ